MASLVTGKVRFSYVYVFTPQTPIDGGDPKYSVTLLIPKSDTATYQAFQNAFNQALQDGMDNGTYNGYAPYVTLANVLHDGDGVKVKSGEPYGPECKGCWVVSASSKSQPGIVDVNIQPILNQKDFYSGCYGRADLNLYPFNAKGNKGVGVGLNNLQKLEDGESLGGGRSAQEAFGGGNAYPQQPAQPQYQPNPYAVTQQPYQTPTNQPYQPAYNPAPAPQQPAIDPLTGLPVNNIMGL